MNQEPRPAPTDDEIWNRILQALEAALEKKAADPVVLDLRESSQLADYFVLLSARSDTQVRAVADAVAQRCKQIGARPLSIEGVRHGQWALLDYGDFVIHVFYEPVRRFYGIERLWSRAQICELPASMTHESGPSREAAPQPPEVR